MADLQDIQIIDPGVDESIAKLTPERIEQTINRVLTEESAARLKVYLQTCVHCGLCAEACQSYVSRNGDPDYAPVANVKDTLWEMVKRKGRVDGDFLHNAARIAFIDCGACRRCSMYCPFGIDISYLIMTVRRILNLLGVVPQYLQDTTNSHAVTMNQMWVQQDDWIDTLMWQEEDAQEELAGTRIPLDKEGADIMYSGDFETMGRVERLHWERAMKLKVKRVVMGECGHAYRGAVYDGPRWLGWTKPPIPMVHAVEFYYELLKSGRLKIVRKIEEPVTVQDPCNIVRGRGLHDKLRYVVNAICDDFRDMDPRYEHNYCCQAGGGLINCGPPWKVSRMKSNKVKAEQIVGTGAHTVITPCHNCHSGIEDIIGYYKIDAHVSFISELLVKTIELPEV